MKKWNEKLGDYLIDVSKYTITGVVLTAFFNDITDRVAMYIVGGFVSAIALYAGLILGNRPTKRKAKERKQKRRNKYGKLHWINVYRHTMPIVHHLFMDETW